MPLCHVGDLVAQHASQLRKICRAFDQPTVDVDEAPRDRESIHLLAVHHIEVPIEVPIIRQPSDRITQYVDVAVDLSVLDNGQLCIDLRCVVLAELNLLLGRYSTAGSRHRQRRAH